MIEVGTPEEMLERWQSAECKCDPSVGFLCELCHDIQVVRELLSSRNAAPTLNHPPESQWVRTKSTSIWHGPNLELIVVQNSRSDESWSWTARGWREPDDCDGADKCGWVNTSSREACEKHALAWYLEKDE